ncbi:hypothetical protein [Sphingomonas sp. RS2018]
MTTHVIHIDHGHACPLVDVRLSGLFEPEAALSAVRAIRTAIRTLGPRIGEHVTLYDTTDITVAPPATITAMQESWRDPEAIRLAARRVAYCSPSALGRLQLARLRQGRADIGVFPGRTAALAWLLSADPDTPVA